MIVGVNKPPPPLELLKFKKGDDTSLSGQYLKDFRVCKTCGEWHQALHSIGTLKCRFHPLSLNEDCESEFHRRGVWPCCGVSPDPRDPEFDATYAKGCTLKDHSAMHCIPCPTKVQEADWPSVLRASMHEDIELVNRSAEPWERIVKKLHYKGIRINPHTDAFYLSRVDDFMVEQRLKHKYYKDERLSVCLRIRHTDGDEVVSYKEIIVEKRLTIGELRRRHFPSLPRITLHAGLAEYGEARRVEELGDTATIEATEYSIHTARSP